MVEDEAGTRTGRMETICNLSPSVTTTSRGRTPLDPAGGDPWTTWEARVWGRGAL
jgi:hypothetical protein